MESRRKRVLMEPFHLMFYHDVIGDVRYFSVAESLKTALNELLEMLIDRAEMMKMS